MAILQQLGQELFLVSLKYRNRYKSGHKYRQNSNTKTDTNTGEGGSSGNCATVRSGAHVGVTARGTLTKVVPSKFEIKIQIQIQTQIQI